MEINRVPVLALIDMHRSVSTSAACLPARAGLVRGGAGCGVEQVLLVPRACSGDLPASLGISRDPFAVPKGCSQLTLRELTKQ